MKLSPSIVSKTWCNCGKTGEFCLSLANQILQLHCNGDMTDQSDIASGSNILRFASKVQKTVAFDRKELGLILSLYGRYVAEGEWRD